MNRTAIHFLLLVTGCLTACRTTPTPVTQTSSIPAQTSSTVNSAATDGRLITTFGEHRIGNTVVEASRSEGKLTVKHLTSKKYDGGRSASTSAMSTPPNEWPLHDGWFAYAHQNGMYVWLYNGSDKMLLVERKESPARNFSNIYGPNNSPIAIPTLVLKQVKEPFRSKLLQK